MRVFISVFAAMMFVSAAAQASTQYTVYCANSKVEIDSRTVEQMKSQRSACPLSSAFNYRMDAESFAKKNFGGVGAKCSCR